MTLDQFTGVFLAAFFTIAAIFYTSIIYYRRRKYQLTFMATMGETHLEKIFANDYLSYQQTTPRWI